MAGVRQSTKCSCQVARLPRVLLDPPADALPLSATHAPPAIPRSRGARRVGELAVGVSTSRGVLQYLSCLCKSCRGTVCPKHQVYPRGESEAASPCPVPPHIFHIRRTSPKMSVG